MVQDELDTLSTCILIDEFEAALEHMEDYKAALNHTFHSALPLHDFCKLFVIPLPGDWPTWYYTKKIIALSYQKQFLKNTLICPLFQNKDLFMSA